MRVKGRAEKYQIEICRLGREEGEAQRGPRRRESGDYQMEMFRVIGMGRKQRIGGGKEKGNAEMYQIEIPHIAWYAG